MKPDCWSAWTYGSTNPPNQQPCSIQPPLTLHAVTNIDYNAKGQRVLLQYGKGSETRYDYEPDTFRLQRLKTTRTSDSALLQDLNYTYDPVGNITQIVDNANDHVYHSNTCVLTGAEYRYDALYRLIAASGREHKGDGQQYDWDDSTHYALTLPNDCQALQNYMEGISLRLGRQHHAEGASHRAQS